MRRILITAAVVIVLLIAVDFAAAAAAEYQVSNRMREQLALPDDPSVTINHFPFLTQALSGDYGKVDVSAERLRVGQLRDLEVRAELYHVRVPLGEVLRGAVRSIHIDDAQGSLIVTKLDLIKQMPGVAKLSIQPVDDGALDQALQNAAQATPGSSVTGITPDQAVRMVATTNLLGSRVDVSVIAVLQLAGRQIQVVPRDIRIDSGWAGAELPGPVQAGLRRLFTIKVDPGTLPFQVTPTTLRAVDDGLMISGVAHDLVITSGTGNARADR
ncbi:MAG TPA: DUF2993 domain-containing protein [Pseudonocardia sp.]|jgi:hypothetical protein